MYSILSMGFVCGLLSYVMFFQGRRNEAKGFKYLSIVEGK